MVSNLPAEFFQRKEKEKKIWKRSLPTPKQANCFELKSLWQILLKLFSVYNFHFLPENLQYKRTNQKALLKSVISYNPNNKNWNNFWAKNYQKILNANKINSWDVSTSRTTKTPIKCGRHWKFGNVFTLNKCQQNCKVSDGNIKVTLLDKLCNWLHDSPAEQSQAPCTWSSVITSLTES